MVWWWQRFVRSAPSRKWGGKCCKLYSNCLLLLYFEQQMIEQWSRWEAVAISCSVPQQPGVCIVIRWFVACLSPANRCCSLSSIDGSVMWFTMYCLWMSWDVSLLHTAYDSARNRQLPSPDISSILTAASILCLCRWAAAGSLLPWRLVCTWRHDQLQRDASWGECRLLTGTVGWER